MIVSVRMGRVCRSVLTDGLGVGIESKKGDGVSVIDAVGGLAGRGADSV